MDNTYANPVTNPMGALEQLANNPAKQMMEQQQQSWQQRQGQLQKLQDMTATSPETDEAERWAAMAQAAAQSPITVGGFGAMIANIGGAYGKTLAAQREANIKNQEALTKLMDSGGGLNPGSMTAMTQAALNPFVNVPGVGLVRKSDAALTLPSNMTEQYTKLYQAFYKNAVDQEMPNPEEWAKQQALSQLQTAMGNREVAGGRSTPFGATAVNTEGKTAPSAPTAPPTSGTAAPAPTSESVSGAETPFQKAQVQTESGGKANAVSPKGALGAWQVMPNTNKNPGFGITPAKDNSPEELNRVGKEYSDAMVQRYGSEPLGAIAYNMGPTATDKWLAAGGKWEKLPAETKNYVGKVITMASMPVAGQTETPTGASASVNNLKSAEDAAVASGDFAKAKELRDIRQRAESQAAPTQPPPTTYKDKIKAKMEEAQADTTGKDLAKEATSLNNAMTASNNMISQLNTLEKLYKTPNMPQGELAPYVQKVRSGLSSLGIDVGKEVGAGDMANAIASNFALHLRTGEGQNLMPGAMSNYEDQILQKMSPTLTLTNEGRLALIDYMRDIAKANARMGTEVNKMTDDRGIVDPAWRVRKERVMKEEMARMADKSRELMNRFGGNK